MPDEADTPQRETTTIMANRPFAAMVRAIADRRNITMPEALEKYARPGIAKEYRKVLDEMEEVLGGEGG